jgi:O-antigen/teichoic acid export membrane protein
LVHRSIRCASTLADRRDMVSDAETAPSERRVVMRGLGWSTVGYPLNVGLLFASQALAAQLLDPKDFGTYTLALSVFLIVALVVQLGLPQSLIKRASAALSRGDEAEAHHEIVAALAVGSVAALVVGGFLASPLGEDLLAWAFSGTAIATVAALVGAKAGLRVLENIVPEAIRAFRDFVRATLYNGLVTNIVLCTVLVVLLVGDTNPSLSAVLLVNVIVSTVTLVPALAALFSKLRHMDQSGQRYRNPVEPAIWLTTVGVAAVNQLDLLVIGAIGTSKDVALYAAPFRLALLVALPIVAVNQVMPPMIAAWHESGAHDRLERALRSTAGAALAASLVLAFVLIAAGRPLLGFLFGDFYEDGWGVLAILSVGYVFQTMSGSCGFVLLMTGHQRAYAILIGVSLAMTAGLDVVMYHVTGIEGVAIATAVMLALQNAGQVVLVRRYVGVNTVASLPAAFGSFRLWRARRNTAEPAAPQS